MAAAAASSALANMSPSNLAHSAAASMFLSNDSSAPRPSSSQQQQQQRRSFDDRHEKQRERDVVAHRSFQSGSQAQLVHPQHEHDHNPSQESLESAQPHSTTTSSQALGSSSPAFSLADFHLLKTIGTGTFARVWLARLRPRSPSPATPHHPPPQPSRVFALKIIRKADVIRLKQVEHVRNERNTLGLVAGHPFITTLLATFADAQHLYMLLDYCPGGEVFTYLRRARRFPENVARFFAGEIVLILEYLHEAQGIAYRDLKPENILVDAEGHLKLVDFGFAKRIGRGRETYTLCGTPEYLAPEVIRNSGHGLAVDWWAFGILVFEFLVGQPPFWHSSPLEIYKMIVDAPIRFPAHVPPLARDLVAACCAKNPSHRLGVIARGAAQVKEHAWFAGLDWERLAERRTLGPFVPHLRGEDDATCFDDYEDPPDGGVGGGGGGGVKEEYTQEMRDRWEAEFEDF